MKKVIPLLSIVLVFIFIASLYNTYKLFSGSSQDNIANNITEAFDPALQQVSGFDETEKRISLMLALERKKQDSAKTWVIILNLLVTIATGVVTLITTISTAKNQTLSIKATIAIAVIAFISTLISFSLGQVTSAKENVAAKIESIKKIRDELESLKPEELPAQLPIINRKLDEL